MRILSFVFASGLGAAAAFAAVAVTAQSSGGSLAPDSRSFELRTYTAAPGKLVDKVESVMLTATDYSPMK